MKGLIFTYLLTYGGAFASFFNPFIGLLVYVAFAILRPESLWHWSVPSGNYSRIVAIALLLGWLVHGLGNWNFGKAKGIVFCLLGFYFWAVLSALQAPDQDRAFQFLESMAKVVLPFLVGITLIDSVARLKALAWTIVLSQGYVALEMNLAYYSGFNRVHLAGFGGMDNNCVAIAMVTGVGFAFFLGLNAPKWWQKGLAFGSGALMGHTVLFSFSRGGMLALMLMGLMVLFLIRLQPRHIAMLAVAGLLGLRLAGAEVQDRFLSSFVDPELRDTSAQSRLDIWADCVNSMEKRPLFGLGPFHWPLVASEYGWPPGKEAHSLWLQLGAELGLPGLAFLLGFYLLTIKRLWPFARGHVYVSDAWLHGAAAMVIAGLFGFLVAAQFVSLVGLEQPYYVVLIGSGVLKVATAPQEFLDRRQLALYPTN